MNLDFDNGAFTQYEQVRDLGAAFEKAIEDTLDKLEAEGPAGVNSKPYTGNAYLTTRAVASRNADIFVIFEWLPSQSTVKVWAVGTKELPPVPPK